MKQIDGRTLSASALEERRRIIIRLKENGSTEKQITAAVGCSKQVIYKLWTKWLTCKNKHEKAEVLKVNPRGIKYGEHRTLSPKQEKIIQNTIIEKYPDEMHFDFALWTREAVRGLILKMFIITMPIRTVGEYLKRWGYTPPEAGKICL